MFTGLVEHAGKVLSFQPIDGSCYELSIDAGEVSQGVSIGDSVAINGCCLTVTQVSGNVLQFQLLEETVRCTNLSGISAGSLVNMERSLLPTTRMGGHFVSGHVDECGEITVFEPRGNDHYLRVRCSRGGLVYLVSKGSISLDGISLTVAEVHDDGFAVWLIPHTLAETNLSEKKVGDLVNLEFDILAKYVLRIKEVE